MIKIDVITIDDVTLRFGVSSPEAAPRGRAVILPGRCEFIEKYRETADALTARGWRVEIVEWRAHGLSGGRDSDNPQRHHMEDFAALTDDLEAVTAHASPNDSPADSPLILLAHSMGGLIAALHLARHPRRYAAAILCAPMFDVMTSPWPKRFARWIVRAACALGLSKRYAVGQGDYNPVEARFSPQNPLSGDPRRYAVLHDAWASQPAMRLGGVTFGWLAAAFRAMDAVTSGAAPLDQVETPVLILSAPDEVVVDSRAHAVAARRFAHARVVEFPGAKHELLMERDDIRDAVWRAVDAFLTEVLPEGARPP